MFFPDLQRLILKTLGFIVLLLCKFSPVSENLKVI